MIIRALTLVCCLAALAGSSAADAAPSPSAVKEELRQLKARIDAVQKRLAAAEQSHGEAADALRLSERAISDANRTLAQLNEQSRTANAKLAAINGDIDRSQADLARQQGALGKLLYEQYAAGRPETLGILLNGGDPNAIARRLHYLTYISQARTEVIARAKDNIARLRVLADTAQSEAKEIAAITAEQVAQRKKLEQEKQARARVLATITRDITQQRHEIGTLRRDETRITRLIEELAQLIAKQAKARAAQQAAPPPQARLRNERLPDARAGSGPFAQLRGQLALPVKGELANRFGSPRQDGGVVWKGLFIAARAGEDVRAVAEGRVVFADWLRGFGNLLIIDHGDSYMSLYGYNETLYKQVGDVIRGGERIAAVGNTGGHSESGLYFELRHEGRPFDPMTWVKMR